MNDQFTDRIYVKINKIKYILFYAKIMFQLLSQYNLYGL